KLLGLVLLVPKRQGLKAVPGLLLEVPVLLEPKLLVLGQLLEVLARQALVPEAAEADCMQTVLELLAALAGYQPALVGQLVQLAVAAKHLEGLQGMPGSVEERQAQIPEAAAAAMQRSFRIPAEADLQAVV
ncbi:hypothetical protein IWW50_006290, partial [Coemansia erecta]